MLAKVETPVVVALITSAVSALIAIFSAVWTARQNMKLEELKHGLQQAAKEEERLLEAKAELDRYREPLVAAANELGDRIDNIRHRGFPVYLRTEGPRRETALRGTLFRFAQYFGWIEILHTSLNYLRFEHDEDTKVVADLLSHIGRTFATDKLDWTNGYESSRLMIWREEQRAIGELMRDVRDGTTPGCVSFASFVDQFEIRYSKWFRTFAADLVSVDVKNSERFARLQKLLAKLVVQLDEENKVYVRFDGEGRVVEPEWINQATLDLRQAGARDD